MNDAAMRFFETDVRPLLVDRCWKCHGPKQQKAALRLDSRDAVMAGGDSGAALVPGNVDESLLTAMITGPDAPMPPDGELSAKQVAVLTRWIELGAPWPAHDLQAARVPEPDSQFTNEDRGHWAFRPMRVPDVPAVADERNDANEIDAFIVDRLQAEGLSPAPTADRLTLLRRATLDLHGLPPTPEQIEKFFADRSPEAYSNLVDRLLASPRYGEHWARHWLDLVRYADSDGYKADHYRPHAWRYRDYVIRSLNDDKPYDRFLMEQLAGDEIAPDDPEALTATGYLRHWPYEYNQRNVERQWNDILNDVTDVTADVFLGLGMGCARCHDHKFDPILQEDYFRLRAFFAPMMPRDETPLADVAAQKQYEEELARWEAESAAIRERLEEIERPHLEAAAQGAIEKFPENIQAMIRTDLGNRSGREHQLAELAFRQVTFEYDALAGKLKGDEKKEWESLQAQLREFSKPEPLPVASTVADVRRACPATTIPDDPQQREIPPGFLSILDPEPAEILPPASAPESTGRRTALARWLVRPDHPLTARVMVNRIWQYHFGTGIVATPSDFGRLGEPPSHMELLDWLAVEFVRSGYSTKHMHRLMMASATYRQRSDAPVEPQARETDPENRLLWRMNVQRLSAEQIRDAALASSGELNLTMGGPSVDTNQSRRTIYTKVLRNTQDPLLDAFDSPPGFESIARRDETTTPTQALLMINGPWLLARAEAMAGRLHDADAATCDEVVERAVLWTLGRAPSAAEREALIQFVERYEGDVKPESSDREELPDEALVDLCHVLLNCNAFLYRN
ncbi:MAG: PSD1 and planctomycete cytochrome C domain-containing protein [Pirellulales bacterium]